VKLFPALSRPIDRYVACELPSTKETFFEESSLSVCECARFNMEISQRLKFLQRSANTPLRNRSSGCSHATPWWTRCIFILEIAYERGNERRQVSRNNVTRLKLISSYIVRKVSRHAILQFHSTCVMMWITWHNFIATHKYFSDRELYYVVRQSRKYDSIFPYTVTQYFQYSVFTYSEPNMVRFKIVNNISLFQHNNIASNESTILSNNVILYFRRTHIVD